MKRLFLLGAIGAALAAAAIACSSSEDTSFETDSGADGNTVLPATDGATPDAVSDASDAGLDVDAAPRICSDDDFCHTTVAKGTFFRGVWSDGAGVTWGITVTGDLLRFDGAAWKLHVHLTDTDSGITSIFGTSPTDIWVATDQGLFRSAGTTPAALAFARVTLPGDATQVIQSIWGTGPADLWAVGGVSDFDTSSSKGRALHFNGTAWTVDTDLSPRGITYQSVFGSPGGGVFVYGTQLVNFDSNAILLQRAAGATSWKVIALPPTPNNDFHPGPLNFAAGALSSDTSLWLSGQDGNFNLSSWHGTKATDGGAAFSWTYKPLGTFARPVYAYWGLGANDTWAVGESGLVDHWDGTTWKPAIVRVTPSPVGKSFWGIWGKSNDDFWIVGDEIAIHKTSAGKP